MKTLLYIFYLPLNTMWWMLNGINPFCIQSYGFLFIRNQGKIKLGKGIVVNSNRYANIIGGATSSSIMIGPNGNYKALPDLSKWILTAGMLLGRLELFAVLVLFFPSFWRN